MFRASTLVHYCPRSCLYVGNSTILFVRGQQRAVCVGASTGKTAVPILLDVRYVGLQQPVLLARMPHDLLCCRIQLLSIKQHGLEIMLACCAVVLLVQGQGRPPKGHG